MHVCMLQVFIISDALSIFLHTFCSNVVRMGCYIQPVIMFGDYHRCVSEGLNGISLAVGV